MRGRHISPFFTIQPVIYVIKKSVLLEFSTTKRFFTIQRLLFEDSALLTVDDSEPLDPFSFSATLTATARQRAPNLRSSSRTPASRV
jgi:hypothetical protein